MQSEFFEKLFVVSADNFFATDENEKYFIFQGSKNWDMYLTDKPKGIEYDILESVKLLNFREKKEFLKKIKNVKTIDYSLEHINEFNSYFVLVSDK